MSSTCRNAGTIARALAVALSTGAGAIALNMPIASVLHAQEVNASVQGRITGDASSVTAVEVDSGVRRTATVGESGRYNFASLRPGNYRLEITTPDGVRRTDVFVLRVAQNSVLNIDLSELAAPADGEEESEAGEPIIVTGDLIRTMEGGEIGDTVTQREISTLPQNNRNFLAFAENAPGVAFVTDSNGNQRLQGGAQQSRSTNVFIDGVGQKDYVLKNGVTGQDSSQGNPFPQLAVGEYRVISSNYKAEFDQVSSVAVTAATRSGTNEFHGEGFIDYTDQSMRAKTPLEKTNGDAKVDTRDFQFGGALGGPIIKDLAHFFVAYEGKRQQIPVDIIPGTTTNTDNIPAEYQDLFGSYNRDFNEDLYFGKIDVVPSTQDLFELSVKVRKEDGIALNSGSNSQQTATIIKNDEVRGLFRYERTNDNWINDFKITYEDTSWSPTPNLFEIGQVFEASDGSQIFRTGGSANYQDKGQKGWGIQDDFTWIGFEGHTIKACVKAKWVKLNSFQQNNFNPVYTYNTEFNPNGGSFNDEVPYRVQFGSNTGIGSPQVSSKNFQLGLYLQDDWEVTDRLTLNIGLRWDMDRTPSYLNYVHPEDAMDAVDADAATADDIPYPNLENADYDINNFVSTGTNRKTFMGAFQPRIGFSYLIDEQGDWTLFGGYGRSYDRNSFDFLQQEISNGSYTTRTINFDTGDPEHECSGPTCVAWDPAFYDKDNLEAFIADLSGGARELRFITNDLKVPYSDQFSLGLRHRVDRNWSVEAGYNHVESKDGFAYLLGNRREDGTFFAEGENWGPPWGFTPPGFGSIIIGTNGIETSSDSAYAKLEKRWSPTSPWNINLTYTYTEAEENRKFNEYFSLDYPSLDDYPVLRSAGVSKHRVVLTGAVDIPWDMTLSTRMVLASAPYIYGIAGTDNTDRVPVVTEGNNAHRAPFFFNKNWAYRTIDLALTKYVPLQFLGSETRLKFRVDVINVLNYKNYTDYNSNPQDDDPTPVSEGGDGLFGDVSSLSIGGNPPRTIKISAGFEF